MSNKIQIQFNGKDLEIESGTTCKGLVEKHCELEGSILYECKGDEDIKIGDLSRPIGGGEIFITISANWIKDGCIEIEPCAKGDRKPPREKGGRYLIRVDSRFYEVDKPRITGKEILALDGKSTEEYDLDRKYSDGTRKPIDGNQEVDLCERGIERFETVPHRAPDG